MFTQKQPPFQQTAAPVSAGLTELLSDFYCDTPLDVWHVTHGCLACDSWTHGNEAGAQTEVVIPSKNAMHMGARHAKLHQVLPCRR